MKKIDNGKLAAHSVRSKWQYPTIEQPHY